MRLKLFFSLFLIFRLPIEGMGMWKPATSRSLKLSSPSIMDGCLAPPAPRRGGKLFCCGILCLLSRNTWAGIGIGTLSEERISRDLVRTVTCRGIIPWNLFRSSRAWSPVNQVILQIITLPQCHHYIMHIIISFPTTNLAVSCSLSLSLCRAVSLTRRAINF